MKNLNLNVDINHQWFVELLACPDCGSSFSSGAELICSHCDYAAKIDQIIDLKPRRPSAVTLTLPVILKPDMIGELNDTVTTSPYVAYKGPAAIRDSSELMSEVMRYVKEPGCVLDLGCGPRDQVVPIEHLGHRYVGVDYSNLHADLLADAHTLPFADNAFDCVLSYAVLEHLHNPFIAIKEVQRVLKPGGVYIGTVSQGEPFHDSFFHHTVWGLTSLVQTAELLAIKRLWSSDDTLWSLSRMGKYPRVIKKLIALVERIHRWFPILAPRRMRWSKKELELDQLYRAGSIAFVIQKSPSSNDNLD